MVRKKWSDDLQDDSETVGPLPEIADQSVEDALRQYWDEVEAMKKLLVEMHRDAHRNLRVQVGEKKVSPTDFETHMRSMVDQRNALYDRLYKDSSTPQRLPHAQTLPTTVPIPDLCNSALYNKDQPLYFETKKAGFHTSSRNRCWRQRKRNKCCSD